MAYSYKIIPEKKLIHILIQASTEFSEIVNCIKEVVFDERYHPDYKILIELRAHYIPTASEMKQIAKLIIGLEMQFKNKVALMVSEDFLNQMVRLAEYYITKRTELNLEVFSDSEESYSWLEEG